MNTAEYPKQSSDFEFRLLKLRVRGSDVWRVKEDDFALSYEQLDGVM
jgi:hypothetical protein